MKIEIETIPHADHHYPTCGDWFEKDGVMHIKVSSLSDWRREALIAVHELVEAMLCKHDGVSEASVDEFDKAYEAARPADDVESEPGDDPRAPYVDQHCFATGIERLLAARLGVKWNEYADEIESLP